MSSSPQNHLRRYRVAAATAIVAGAASLIASLPAGAAPGSRVSNTAVSTPRANVPVLTVPAPQPCTVKGVTVAPAGSGATFSVLTSVDTKVGALVTPANTQPGGSFGGDGNYTTWHTFGILAMLEPGTQYNYKVSATTPTGGTCSTTGSFTSLHRRLRVTFDQVTVLDDSDDLSAGDFFINLKVGSSWFLPFQSQLPGPYIAISSNSIFPMNFTKEVLDGPLSFDIGAELYDSDNNCDNMCILPGDPPPFYVPSGSDGKGDWATTVQSFQAPNGGQPDQGNFSLQTTNYKVKFVMTGHYTLDYV